MLPRKRAVIKVIILLVVLCCVPITWKSIKRLRTRMDQNHRDLLLSQLYNDNDWTITNPHPFQVTLQPRELCPSNQSIFLLIYVHSAPDNLKRRLLIRQTWGGLHNFPSLNVRLMFVLGQTNGNSLLQEAIALESSMYRDVLQEDFLDSYRNLTYKAIAALKYISSHCSNVKFLLKIDDDVFVNIFTLVRHLRSLLALTLPTNTIFCSVWVDMKVIREVNNKWYVSEQDWPTDTYPHYCSGSAYIMSGDLPGLLYNTSYYTPFFWVDDLYITGLVARKARVRLSNFGSTYQLNFIKFTEAYLNHSDSSRFYIFSHNRDLNKFRMLWKFITGNNVPHNE